MLSKRSLRSYGRAIAAPILFGLICFLVYNANLRQIGAGDTLPARYLPLILWHYGTLDLNESERLVAHGHSPSWNRQNDVVYVGSDAYWMVRARENRLASTYPIVTPLLVAPLYLPAVVWLNAHGWEQPNIDRVAELMEKFSASLLASIASVLMYLVLRRDGTRWSLPLAIGFAFGTNTWMISSQALWQHGAGELLIALALLLVIADVSAWRTTLLGAVCVLMAANRPPDALIACAILVFVVWTRKLRAVWLLAGAVLPLAVLVWYNLFLIGNAVGGYALAKAQPKLFFHLNWSGVPALLVSPTRGLLVFSPFLLFVPLGLVQRFRSPKSRQLAVVLSLGVAAQLLLYSQTDWRTGFSWGPRWLTDLLPALVWMLAPAPIMLRTWRRGLLIAAMVVSVLVQLVGAVQYTQASDARIFADPTSMRGAWDPRNTPFIVELGHPRPPRGLKCDADGSIDRVGSTMLPGNGEIPTLQNGTVLEGSALACGHSPTGLFVILDGIVVGSNAELLPAADRNGAHIAIWRATADTRGVSPGERVLQLGVFIGPGNDLRIVHEQRVNVIAPQPSEKTALQPGALEPGLEALAARSASLLRERQSAPGYWLTSFTQDLHYEAPHQEMNTYLTSMLVDVLSPVAPQRSLSDVLDRARLHLSAQIESNGLVRYHGLPDAPTIKTLGAVITPDADDTALVWRIAGPGASDPRERTMLEVLTRYRDTRGLYRTWLAPQNEYQSIDPGRDPNPADVAIQMHVYLMLRELDPTAGRNLCVSLQRSFSGRNIWVYYDKAPLVPYLRAAELRQLGCPVPLPTDRLGHSVAGQEIWNEAARRLVEINISPKDASARQAIRDLLARIGSDEFAQVRRNPPLLYHNDLSASVKRFYWSEDFGYALWLRLYEAAYSRNGQLER